MAADHYTTEHHLTRDGWIAGTTKTFGRVDGSEIARPPVTVETWEEDGRQSSPYSKDVLTHRLLWYDESVPEQERQELRRRFKPPFMEIPRGF
jgi:hypothetical protein